MSLKALLQERAHALGFQAVGVTSAAPFLEDEAAILDRIDRSLMDGLPWFTRERAHRATHPGALLPGARSVVALAASYFHQEPAAPAPDGPRGRVARYAWGADYHTVLRERCERLVDALAVALGRRPAARVFVDSSPLAERAVARRAGVGWTGKNTNILVPRTGSWVFLASIILDVDLEPDAPLRTHCGSCTRCIDACPTGAITEPYVLDNTRCISYQTIENRGAVPAGLRPGIGDWVFGCDICQEVCPVNRRPVESAMAEFAASDADRTRPLLTGLLALSDTAFRERFQGTAVLRAKAAGLRRNAAVALGNVADAATVAASAAVRDGRRDGGG